MSLHYCVVQIGFQFFQIEVDRPAIVFAFGFACSIRFYCFYFGIIIYLISALCISILYIGDNSCMNWSSLILNCSPARQHLFMNIAILCMERETAASTFCSLGFSTLVLVGLSYSI